ncbi:MAG: hypothetical protein KDJ62_15845, partial [Rhodobiaceae bacterium]|nr:hypothetical protein [Rhodobiaceae bacterium]
LAARIGETQVNELDVVFLDHTHYGFNGHASLPLSIVVAHYFNYRPHFDDGNEEMTPNPR